MEALPVAGESGRDHTAAASDIEIDAEGKFVVPGLIDGHVQFRLASFNFAAPDCACSLRSDRASIVADGADAVTKASPHLLRDEATFSSAGTA